MGNNTGKLISVDVWGWEKKIKEYTKEYRQCIEKKKKKNKTLHQIIPKMHLKKKKKKRDNRKFIWVGMYWWYGKTEVAKEHLVQHG